MCFLLNALSTFVNRLESKSARKNRKRREAKKATEGFVIEEEIPVSKPPPAPVDPFTALQTQLSEAKAAKVSLKVCM